MSHMPDNTSWQSASTDIFWKEIARHDHVLQLYDNDEVFLKTLLDFVESGIHSNENVIVVATNSHLNKLEFQMEKNGLDVEKLISSQKYIPLSAEETMEEFMINDMLSEELFVKITTELLKLAGYGTQKVRLFGEVVTLLLEKGNVEATVLQEDLTNQLCTRHPFLCVFCAYPKKLMEDNFHHAKQIYDAHSKLIYGSEYLLDIRYQKIA
jgi:DcmR-like sensory protein